jgi:hypothetical protein
MTDLAARVCGGKIALTTAGAVAVASESGCKLGIIQGKLESVFVPLKKELEVQFGRIPALGKALSVLAAFTGNGVNVQAEEKRGAANTMRYERKRRKGTALPVQLELFA